MTVYAITSNAIVVRVALLGVALMAMSGPVRPQGQPLIAPEVFTEKSGEILLPRIERGTLMRGAFKQHVDWSHVAKGTALEGTFSAPVYAGQHSALPAGTQLRVTISSSRKVRDPQGFWRTVGRTFVWVFNPLEKTRAPQYCVTLSSVELRLPTGEWVSAEAHAVRAGASIVMNPRRSDPAAVEHAPRAKNKPAQILLLQLDKELNFAAQWFVALPRVGICPDGQKRSRLLTHPIERLRESRGRQISSASRYASAIVNSNRAASLRAQSFGERLRAFSVAPASPICGRTESPRKPASDWISREH